ncbi:MULTISPECIES: TIGR01244 family sulfur transferase [unclassified Brevundimonas]|uniref:TIGR01244 family sulfur transferase n=1 Tax=unclassified Brevundimonas TaxID=2622653 RepID=UPI0014314B7E|nr:MULTISPECIES: TIGR01244 family sulfur transferase [unclassified Brevundimonas]
MIHLAQLENAVLVSSQIRAEDLARLMKQGVALVISHRPDDEELGQPTAQDLDAAARDVGLTFIHAPVRGLPDEAAIAATAQALEGAGSEGTALLFCRSGMRSAAAWAMARARQGVDAASLRAAAAAAGYDLSRVPL